MKQLALPEPLLTVTVERARRTGPSPTAAIPGARVRGKRRGGSDRNVMRISRRSRPWKARIPAPKIPSKHYQADKRVIGKDGVQVCVSMPIEDFTKLCELARRLRVSRSQLIRDLVGERHAEIAWERTI